MPEPLIVWNTINWRILKEMGIPGHLTCLLRNLCACQEATVRTGYEQWTGSKLGKEYVAGVQPQWIQGIRSGDGVGEEKLVYLIRNIKRLRGNSIV